MRHLAITLTTATALLLTGCATTEATTTNDEPIIPTETQALDLCHKAAQAHQNARTDTWTKATRTTDAHFPTAGELTDNRVRYINGDYYADAGTWSATCAVHPGEDGNLPYAVITVWDLNVGGSHLTLN